MFIRFFVCICVLLVLSACVYNDAPMPVITDVLAPEIYTPSPALKIPVTKAVSFEAGWVPPRYLDQRGRWRGIIIHHSASSYGCAAHEDKTHKDNGWGGLGYHFVINNGVYRHGYGKADGFVEVGYRWRQQAAGSHCRPKDDKSNYWNERTIGICLIGNFEITRPTERQWRALVKLIRFLQNRYNIPTNEIKGHRDVKPTKCPGKNFSFDQLRRRLSERN